MQARLCMTYCKWFYKVGFPQCSHVQVEAFFSNGTKLHNSAKLPCHASNFARYLTSANFQEITIIVTDFFLKEMSDISCFSSTG